MLKHSYTFEGHPVACAVALKTLEILERENLVENSKIMGKYLFDSLQSFRKHPIVGEIRGGLGLDCSFDFVKNKETMEKFNPEENSRIIVMLKEKLRKEGLWGAVSNPFQLKPALVIKKDEIDEIMNRLDKVISEIEKELFVDSKIG